MTQRRGTIAMAAGIASIAILATACSSSGGTRDEGAGSPTSGAHSVASGVPASALSRAKAALAPYTGKFSAFPVTTPLAKKPPAGSKLAFLNCATPFCPLLGGIYKQAADSLGTPLSVVVKAGPSAQALQQAMSSIVAAKPSALLLPGVDPVQYRQQMAELAHQKVPVVTTNVVDGAQFPAIKGGVVGSKALGLAGQLLADWTVERNGDGKSVFYTIPELSFSAAILSGYQSEMKALCPACDVRVVKLPVATIGSTAPSSVVRDLQSHPGTKTALFGAEEAVEGLPAALKVAGLKVSVNGFAPSTAVLGYIQDGQIDSGLAYDVQVACWQQVDIAARLLTGQALDPAERNDELVYQMIQRSDLKGKDTKRGFSAYPDVAARFEKLWAGAS